MVFAQIHQWKLALSLIILGASFLPCWLITRRGNFLLGLMLAQIVGTVFLIIFCLMFDVPDEATPRTAFNFFLVIAIVGYSDFQQSRSKVQLAIILANLTTFVFFASTSLSVSFADPIPASFHTIYAWFNVVLAVGMLCGGILVVAAGGLQVSPAVLDLHAALAGSQFELYYQPQIHADGFVLGAETLLRWRHPKRGYISPGEFIPLAERIGVMPHLGNWVVIEACDTLARWQTVPFTRNMTLAINVTADQFATSNFVEMLEKAVHSRNVDPTLLKLELTESAFLNDVNSVITKMHALNEAGFSVALDDFGTGYSSLSYLRQLPLKQLKIDRSFVLGVTDSDRGAAIVKHIVQMGHDLDLDVLAEGIETEDQLSIMLSYGCSAFQGFLFGKPMPRSAFEAYAAHQSV